MMGMARDPAKFKVFHRAHGLVLDIYRLTGKLPSDERFGLSAQLRRAAASIPTNIVEGASRRTSTEFHRFLDIAHGSAAEVHYLLQLAVDLGMLAAEDAASCLDCSDHVARELQELQKTVNQFVVADLRA
jgi:four helix bundle protein